MVNVSALFPLSDPTSNVLLTRAENETSRTVRLATSGRASSATIRFVDAVWLGGQLEGHGLEQIGVRSLAEHVQSSLAGTAAMLSAAEAVVAPVFMVGGGVRDAAMGRPLKDYDFATPLATSQIKERVRSSGHRAHTAGRRFGTIGFKMHGSLIQVSTFRGQPEGADPARSDRQVLVALEKDLSHRDFTVNAMAVARGTIVDPFGGLSDVRHRVLRAVGSPRSRISEDPIRLLRAARFISELGFVVEAGTQAETLRSAHKGEGLRRPPYGQDHREALPSRVGLGWAWNPDLG